MLLERGDVAGAHLELERAGLLDDERPLYLWGPYVRGLVRLARGDTAAACADLRDVGRHAEEVGGFAAGLPWGAHVALAHLALGEHAAARSAAAQELERARILGTPRRVGIALRVWVSSRRTASSSHICPMPSTSSRPPRRFSSWRRLSATSASPCCARDAWLVDGRALLERSHDAARACGARGLAQSTHDELRVAGARPRRLTFSGSRR